MLPKQQQEYADDLMPNKFGAVPVSVPFRCDATSGKVGDVGYFLPNGSYYHVINAFDVAVAPVVGIV
jgi:hypothetical protein